MMSSLGGGAALSAATGAVSPTLAARGRAREAQGAEGLSPIDRRPAFYAC
jgi:hypothetical protein